jgi:hypothetical protein
MRFLVDTQILLSLIERQLAGLPMWVQAFLTDSHSEYHLSAASPLEIAINPRLGKLRLKPRLNDLPELLDSHGIAILSITPRLCSGRPRAFQRNVRSRTCASSQRIARSFLIRWLSNLSRCPTATIKTGGASRSISLFGSRPVNAIYGQWMRLEPELPRFDHRINSHL